MTSKKIICTISIFFSLITIVLVVFVVFPLFKKIRTTSEEIISEKNSIATLRIQEDEIENFRKNYPSYRPNLEKMEQLFIDTEDPIDFIKFLEETASDCGVTSEISLLPSSEENKNSVTFQFFSNGDFSKILKFSEKLENGPYLVKINNLTINNSSEKVNANFSIEAFSKP
jgi:hypothetical protein